MSDRLQLLTCVEGDLETLVVGLLAAADSVQIARRCADLAEVLGAAAAGRGSVVVLSAMLPGLDRVMVADIQRRGGCILGVYNAQRTADADQATTRFNALGITHTCGITADTSTPDLVQAVRSTDEGRSAGEGTDPSSTPQPEATPTSAALWQELDDAPPPARGTLLTVWGPVGAPGRTTIAAHLAARLARSGRRVLLVDADTYGASVAQLLGILDEAPGVAAACRHAHAGSLTRHVLAELSPTVMPNLHVLTGIQRIERWPELSEVGLGVLWDVARSYADVTVVDTSFCLEADEPDLFAPRRNGATLSAVENADAVIAVGTADPVGLARLIRGTAALPQLTEAPVLAVVNRLRQAVTGSEGRAQIEQALEDLARSVVTIEEDQAAADAVLRNGVAAVERPSRAALGHGVNRVAAELVKLGALRPVTETQASGSGRWRDRIRR